MKWCHHAFLPLDIGRESRSLSKAVNDIWQSQSLTASGLFNMLDEAGFVDITKNKFWISGIYGGSGIPKIRDGVALQIYRQALGNGGTSFAQDSLFFNLGWWTIDSKYNLFIIYNPETDEIISISADAPDSE